MSTIRHRVYFDEPIVRAKISRIRFPKTCPVCGAPATTCTRISTHPRKKIWLHPASDAKFLATKEQQLANAETKSFLVDVCADHTISDNAEMRARTLSILVASLMVCISIFALIYAGADVWAGRPISPWIYSYAAIFLGSLFLAYISFRPSAFETAFKIIGFDFELQNVWIMLSNSSYRELFVEENPLSSELVNWVVKV
ncbi:MAG: hypothetical protein EAX87_00295 [Candidatus Thorarchaeota archaeon]|nr:hypothetical protein [Candidatus Thorarchaeota archaeon]